MKPLRRQSHPRPPASRALRWTAACSLLAALTGCQTPPPPTAWQPIEARALAAQSTYLERMTPSLATEILEATIRARHDADPQLQLTSLEVTPERFRYGCIVWGEQQGWNPLKTISVDISWYAVRQMGVNVKWQGPEPVYSVWFRFMTRDVERLFHVGSAAGSGYTPADVTLALATLTNRAGAAPVAAPGSEVAPTPSPQATPPRYRARLTVAERQRRLLQLDRLYERGQLTAEIYRARRRELLLAPVAD
ncbi:MAG: hypothetical protein K9N49_04460 [Candidatus Marinimicrobia bacterium]|nr:hypothetical protein [Candidatus Neomarinimicrobiota bacterium]